MELLASGFAALESPTLDGDGALLFSDLRAGGIYRLAERRVEVVIPERRDVGGICLHADGGLVVSGEDLRHGSRILLGLPGATFNDIAADAEGRVLAGVLRERGAGTLVRVDAPGEYEILLDGIDPNGIGLSPDRSRIYIADTFAARVIVLGGEDISTAAIAGCPDGLAVDAEGCVWVAFYRGGCVARFAPSGELLRRVEMPALKPLSVCLTADSQLYVVTATRAPGSSETGCVYRFAVEAPADPVEPVQI